jgi:stage II sporulation protein Q
VKEMKRNLKLFAVPIIYTIALFLFGISIFYVGKIAKLNKTNIENTNYVSYELVTDNEYVPVVYAPPTIMKPYLMDTVTISHPFYNYEDESSNQEKSLIFYENTYIQNSGVDYTNKEIFDVFSVLDGTVIDVTENDILGKTIKIRHNNELVSTYECLSEVNVKIDDTVMRGERIGKSGTSNMYPENSNLHFELSYSGKNIDPELSYNKTIDEL